MSTTRVIPVLLLAMLAASPVTAQEGQEKPKPDPKLLRLHLMDGSLVSARLTVDTITVATEFGALEVPVAKIVSFTPGLESHPVHRKRIGDLIQQLGAGTATLRDQAEKELADMGLAVKALLEAFREDTDPERKMRVGRLLEQMEQSQNEAEEEGEATSKAWIADDTVQTTKFTVIGRISPPAFKVQTKFGVLTVALGDIRRAEREVEQTPEVRRTITVAGQNLVVVNYKNAGIHVKRGDRVSIDASGTVFLPPWGGSSGPDGAANYGTYKPNLPVGALVGRIGASGEEFMVGSSHRFTARKSGPLYFAVAMHTSYLSGYTFTGDYKVKVRVTPGDPSKAPTGASPAKSPAEPRPAAFDAFPIPPGK